MSGDAPVCDFCCGASPRWKFEAACSLVIESPTSTLQYDSTWAACDECAALVEARDMAGLVARVLRTMPPDSTPYLTVLYSDLLRLLGPREPMGDVPFRGATEWDYSQDDLRRARRVVGQN